MKHDSDPISEIKLSCTLDARRAWKVAPKTAK
jgi:hypothetical protein